MRMFSFSDKNQLPTIKGLEDRTRLLNIALSHNPPLLYDAEKAVLDLFRTAASSLQSYVKSAGKTNHSGVDVKNLGKKLDTVVLARKAHINNGSYPIEDRHFEHAINAVLGEVSLLKMNALIVRNESAGAGMPRHIIGHRKNELAHLDVADKALTAALGGIKKLQVLWAKQTNLPAVA